MNMYCNLNILVSCICAYIGHCGTGISYLDVSPLKKVYCILSLGSDFIILDVHLIAYIELF